MVDLLFDFFELDWGVGFILAYFLFKNGLDFFLEVFGLGVSLFSFVAAKGVVNYFVVLG